MGFWVDSCFLSAPEKYCATFFRPSWFLIRNPLLLYLCVFSIHSCCFCLVALKSFSLSLVFRNFILVCLGVDFFGFPLWITQFLEFIDCHSCQVWGVFGHSFSECFFCRSFLPSGMLMTQMLDLLF